MPNFYFPCVLMDKYDMLEKQHHLVGILSEVREHLDADISCELSGKQRSTGADQSGPPIWYGRLYYENLRDGCSRSV